MVELPACRWQQQLQPEEHIHLLQVLEMQPYGCRSPGTDAPSHTTSHTTTHTTSHTSSYKASDRRSLCANSEPTDLFGCASYVR